MGFYWNNTASVWEMADSQTQNWISTHFTFDSSGLTVYGSSSGYKARVATDSFQILNASDNELMTLSAKASGNESYATLTNGGKFGGLNLTSAMSALIITGNGISMGSGNQAACDFNKIASIEVSRMSANQATGDFTISFPAIGTVEALDIYYWCTYTGSSERLIKRVNFLTYSGTSATSAVATLDALAVGEETATKKSEGLYYMAQTLSITRSGNSFTFTRTSPVMRFFIPLINEDDNKTNADVPVASIKNPGNTFRVYHVAVCAR